MKFSNVDRLKRKIAALPRAVYIELREALQQSATEIVETAKNFTPVRSGDLRDSIDFTFGEYVPAGPNVRDVAAGRGGHDLSVVIHAGDEHAFYAGFVEFGTAPAKGHKGTAAHPFFYPAYRLGKKRAKSRISRATTKAAKRVAAS